MLEMTQAQYAEHRGVTKQAINKLVKAGKIPVTVDAKGRKVIDAVVADRALGEVRERVNVGDDGPSFAPRSTYTPPQEGGGLTKAKTATEVYRARLAQLEYEERVGKLLSVDDVTRAMENCAEAIIRDLDRLPSKADDFAAAYIAGELSGLRAALREAVRGLRATLAETMRAKMAETDCGPEEATA